MDTILLLVVYLMFSSAEDRNRNCCPRVLLNFAVAARSSRLNLRDKESSWFSDDVPWRNEGHNSRTSMGYPSFCSIGWKPQDDHQLHRNLAAPRTKQNISSKQKKIFFARRKRWLKRKSIPPSQIAWVPCTSIGGTMAISSSGVLPATKLVPTPVYEKQTSNKQFDLVTTPNATIPACHTTQQSNNLHPCRWHQHSDAWFGKWKLPPFSIGLWQA